MKKILSLVLAVMLLMGTVAFAATDTITNGTKETDWDTDTGDIDAFDTVQYADDADYDTEGKMATELWLQVDATGQIDVTVPLVLVFQTNIDGGQAKTGADYKITNNSTANLAVTKVEVDLTENSGMDLKEYTETALTEDQYAVKMTVKDRYITGDAADYTFDFTKTSEEKDKIDGGLFELAKKVKDATTGTATTIDVDMKTGVLSFVTSRKEADDKDAGIDETKGVQLLTVTYTVAISTKDAKGEEIKGATVSTDLEPAGTVVEADNTADGTTLGGIKD